MGDSSTKTMLGLTPLFSPWSSCKKKKKIKLFHHGLYSPDLAPCDFWLLPVKKRSFLELDLTLFKSSKAQCRGTCKASLRGASCMSWKSGPADWTSALQSRETMLKSNFYKHICISKNYKIMDQVLFMLERPSYMWKFQYVAVFREYYPAAQFPMALPERSMHPDAVTQEPVRSAPLR